MWFLIFVLLSDTLNFATHMTSLSLSKEYGWAWLECPKEAEGFQNSKPHVHLEYCNSEELVVLCAGVMT